MQAVDGVSFELAPGEILAIVGESGCGKSVTAQTLMGLTRAPNATIAGSVCYRGRELNGLDDDQLRDVRGEEIAMIFQDPMCSLNPVYRVGDQITEMIQAHRDVSKKEAADRGRLLRSVGIPNPERRVRDYPHEFSGGMRQRVMIAMALALEPEVLIADEPTTALDVTVQAQILQLIDGLNRERDLAVVLMTSGWSPRLPTGWSCTRDRSSRTRRSTKSSTSIPTRGGCWVRSRGSINPGPHDCHRSRGHRPRCWLRRRAAASPRAAHTPSTSATSRRRCRRVCKTARTSTAAGSRAGSASCAGSRAGSAWASR